MADHPNLPRHNPNATVRSIAELLSLDDSVTEIIIDNGVGDSNFTVLDLSRFTKLRKLEIGDHCMSYVTTVKIKWLLKLESVVIGKNSFTKCKNEVEITSDPNRRFELNGCDKLKSLKIGSYSFSDYSMAVIENNFALEGIEMGDRVFVYASLKLSREE